MNLEKLQEARTFSCPPFGRAESARPCRSGNIRKGGWGSGAFFDKMALGFADDLIDVPSASSPQQAGGADS